MKKVVFNNFGLSAACLRMWLFDHGLPNRPMPHSNMGWKLILCDLYRARELLLHMVGLQKSKD